MHAAVSLLVILLSLICPSAWGQQHRIDRLSIYSRTTGDYMTVEKLEDSLTEQGFLRSRQFELLIVRDGRDSEIRTIQGTAGGNSITGSIEGRGYDIELNLNCTNQNQPVQIRNVMEKRGDRLDMEFSRSAGTSSVKSMSLTAVNTPDRIKVYSEDEDEKTAFYILFTSKEATIFGNVRGLPVSYRIQMPAARAWLTTEELIIGSIHLALTGYFIP